MKSYTIMLLAFLVLSFGCSKRSFDNRLKYTGNYQFMTIMSSTPIKLPVKDTIYYQGTIDLWADDNIITLHVLPYLTLNCGIQEDGTLGSTLPYGDHDGEFDTENSLYLNFYMDNRTHRTYFHVVGKRIN
jgi:hypothetical protein